MKESFPAIVSRGLFRFFQRRIQPQLHCYCLGIDIVAYSTRTTDVQNSMVRRVQRIIETSRTLANVKRRNLVFLPTGDGMIICLLGGSDSPILIVRLAEEIQKELKDENEGLDEDQKITLRMGIHSGTGSSYVDINSSLNIAGTVANMTQRVMSFGAGWHVLASQIAFDEIASLDRGCQHLFHSIGIGEEKHKNPIVFYNVYRNATPEFGNTLQPDRITPINPISIGQQSQIAVPVKKTEGRKRKRDKTKKIRRDRAR